MKRASLIRLLGGIAAMVGSVVLEQLVRKY